MENVDKQIFEEMQELVLARLRATTDELILSIGDKDYTKDEILTSVASGDEIGQQIIEMQMDYLRDMANGAFYEQNV